MCSVRGRLGSIWFPSFFYDKLSQKAKEGDPAAIFLRCSGRFCVPGWVRILVAGAEELHRGSGAEPCVSSPELLWLCCPVPGHPAALCRVIKLYVAWEHLEGSLGMCTELIIGPPLLTGVWGAARMQTGRERDENCRRSKSRLVLETCTRG